MQFAMSLLEKLPGPWARLGVLIVFLLILGAPELRDFIVRRRVIDRRVDEAHKILQFRLLQLQVATIKTQERIESPEAAKLGTELEEHAERILNTFQETHQPIQSLPDFATRLKFAAGGVALFLLLANVVGFIGSSGLFSGVGPIGSVIAKEVVVAVVSVAVAICIPRTARWRYALLGFLFPWLVALLAVLAGRF